MPPRRSLPATLAAGDGLDRQAPQPDEAGRVLVAEAVGGLIGRELVVVERALGPAAGHVALPGVEAQADVAGHELLAAGDEGVERVLERRVPEAVVDELRVARL